MKKKWTSLALALCLTASMLVFPASAGYTASEGEMIQVVNALGIMVGDSSGDMGLGRNVTRAEFITMAVKATPGGDRVGQASASPYPDVPYSHWAAGYVEAGVKAGYISGYTDGTFRPGNQITLAEGVTIVLKVLGYSAGDFTGVYPSGQMALYQSLDLDEGMTLASPGGVMTRRDAMTLFYNMLTAPTKTGTLYLAALGHTPNAAGEVDVVALVNKSMKGPVVTAGGWKDQIPFDLSSAKIYKGKTTISAGEIGSYDVVYWSDTMKSVWVYSDRVTGTIQALSPSESSPAAVTLAGKTYTIETAAAAYALSNLGSFGLGDQVTLLLGRDGGVAGVAATTEVAANGGERVGIITALSRESYSNADGAYIAETVTILATDGASYSYPWYNSSYKVGDAVRVRVSNNGDVTLTRASSSSGLSGKVSANGTAIGSQALAANVEILDIFENSGVRVYPARLAGLTISSGSIQYYSQNTKGEVDKLVLKDVTGDMHQYGILTGIDGAATDMAISMLYTVDLGGQVLPVSSSIKFSVETGPVQIKGSTQMGASGMPGVSISKMVNLTAVSIDRTEGDVAYAGSRSYTLADNVAVYTKDGDRYLLTSLDRVKSGYTLTAYYDKEESQGGLIRVIVAK